MSVGGPEAHFLLTNSSTTAIEFTASLGSYWTTEGEVVPKCARNRALLDPDVVQKFVFYLRPEVDTISKGVIPANGWVHRAFPLIPWLLPCKIPFGIALKLDQGTRIVEGEVSLDGKHLPYFDAKMPEEELTTEFLIERTPQRDHLTLRILAQNDSPKPVTLKISDRQIECTGGSRADWSVVYPVLQGLDSGLVNLREEGGWIAFVFSIRLFDQEAVENCEGWVEVSTHYSGEVGWLKPVKRVKFNLSPKGYNSPALHGIDSAEDLP